jgi:signal transduction histidine kinase
MDSSINIEAFNCIFRDISPSMHDQTHPSDIANLVIKRITEVLRAKGALIRTLNQETRQLDLAVSYGLSERYLSKGPVSWEKIIEDFQPGDEILILEDVRNDSRIQYPEEVNREGIRMIVDSPLILRDQIIGIIRIYFAEQREISSEEMDFLLFTSRQAACAIEKAGLIESQRHRYQELALQTEKMSSLGRLAAGIAHEINNPLAGILLYSSSLIKKAPKEGPIKDGLEVIINETKRCKAIIQDLLEFSRAGEPKTVLGNLNEIIEKALSILENEFSLRHIRIQKHLSKERLDVFLDEKQIQQVFINVLLNAAQAIENNGVITIRSSVDPGQACARVEFFDSGPGIPEDHLARIFEPFFSTKTNGTGLGLSVSYGIIQNHQGKIRVSSQTGRETCVTIDFPLSGGSPGAETGGGTNEGR